MRKSFKVTLGCREWTVKPAKIKYGECVPQDRVIKLNAKQTPDDLQDTFIHEALHALFWFLDEEVVRQAATELNNALDEFECNQSQS